MVPEVPTFTVGVEEEYFVVDRTTRDLVPDIPDELRAALEQPPVGMTSPEFIRSQIEIGTRTAPGRIDGLSTDAAFRYPQNRFETGRSRGTR